MILKRPGGLSTMLAMGPEEALERDLSAAM
jgi:hypothetical protein